VIYWDTSAICKLYVAEPDSHYFLNLLAETREQIASSAIMCVEVLCTLWRKERSGELRDGGASAGFRKLNQHIEAGRLVLIPYGPNIVAEVEKVLRLIAASKTHSLVRSLDAIHIASALECKATSLIATDNRLREIATLAGLQVLP
jgi:predicted nucleic acid-binding protein